MHYVNEGPHKYKYVCVYNLTFFMAGGGGDPQAVEEFIRLWVDRKSVV